MGSYKRLGTETKFPGLGTWPDSVRRSQRGGKKSSPKQSASPVLAHGEKGRKGLTKERRGATRGWQRVRRIPTAARAVMTLCWSQEKNENATGKVGKEGSVSSSASLKGGEEDVQQIKQSVLLKILNFKYAVS